MGGIENKIGKVKELVMLLCQQSLLAIQAKKKEEEEIWLFLCAVTILKKLNTTVKRV